MANIQPLDAQDLPQFKALFDKQVEAIGYIPVSLLTMGRDPGLLTGVGGMFDALWYPPVIGATDHWLVTYAYSWFAKSHYSAAHCACGGVEAGLTLEQVSEIGRFETSTAFDARQKALVGLCKAAAHIPVQPAAERIEALRADFDERQIVFITGLIAFVSYLNKWNELAGSELEPKPKAWAERHMPAFG